MSFDIYVNEEGKETHWVKNITSNLGSFFAWALHGTDPERNPDRTCDSAEAVLKGRSYSDGLQGMDGMTLAQAEPMLRAAISKVEGSKREFLDRFNAANGWGTWSGGGIETLRAMLLACEDAEGEAKESRTFSISY